MAESPASEAAAKRRLLLQGAHGSCYSRPMSKLPFRVYVLRSSKDRKLYIGFTANLKERLSDHFHGEVASTASRRPLELIYCEYHASKTDALRRESCLHSLRACRTHPSRQMSSPTLRDPENSRAACTCPGVANPSRRADAAESADRPEVSVAARRVSRVRVLSRVARSERRRRFVEADVTVGADPQQLEVTWANLPYGRERHSPSLPCPHGSNTCSLSLQCVRRRSSQVGGAVPGLWRVGHSR